MDGPGPSVDGSGLELIEVARADAYLSDEERDHMIELLGGHLELSAEECTELVSLAHSEAETAISLHEFTHALHGCLDDAEKNAVIALLWQVALLDGELHRHEDHIIRRIADLLYVRHADLIRIRNAVRGA